MDALADLGNNVEQRFWAKVDKRSDSECWIWTAKAKTIWGYGVFRVSPVYGNEGAHRIAYMLANGGAPLPKGKFVLHACDNPACCNPAHLSLGTPMDNMRDMIAKGRKRDVPLRGERNGMAKIKNTDVAFIRRNNLSASDIVAQYGLSRAVAHRIRSGRSWKDVA